MAGGVRHILQTLVGHQAGETGEAGAEGLKSGWAERPGTPGSEERAGKVTPGVVQAVTQASPCSQNPTVS